MKDDDFKLLKGFAERQTEDRQTFVIVESLLRLKRGFKMRQILNLYV